MIVGLSLIVVGGVFGGLSYLKDIADNNKEISNDIISTYTYRISGNYHSTISADSIDSFEIEVDKAKVLLKEHEEDKIEVTVNNDKNVEVHVDGNALQIEQNDVIFGEECEIIIYIPFNKVFHEVSCSLGDGSMTLHNVAATEIELEVGAGEIEIDYLESQNLSAEIGAGQCAVKNGSVQDAEVEVGMGQFTWNGMISHNMEAECGIGQMSVYLEEEEEYYSYTLTSGIGKIGIGDSSYSGVTSKQIDNVNANATLLLECGIGQIEIYFGNEIID